MSTKFCNICGSQNAFLNYGAISCRACGAFFRRFILYGTIYECKCYKNGQNVNSSMSIGCKSCRLKKCIENGMRKEMVRSVNLHNFHRKRQQEMKEKKVPMPLEIHLEKFSFHKNLNSDTQLIQMLLGLQNKMEMFRNCINVIPMEFFAKFDSLEMLLIENKNNLLTNPQLINESNMAPNSSQYINIEGLHKNDRFFDFIPMLVTDLWIFVNFARSIPTYNRLQFGDQVTLLKHSTMASLMMFDNYFSAKRNSETLITYEGLAIFPIYAYQYPDPILLNAAKRIFNIPPQEFMRIDLAKDELAILMALLFTNSAIPGLSPYGQQILKEDEEKYGKMLLSLQQRRFGENAGALRYLDSLGLVWSTIRQVQKRHEIAIYIDSIYHHGKFEKIVPKSLFPMLV